MEIIINMNVKPKHIKRTIPLLVEFSESPWHKGVSVTLPNGSMIVYHGNSLKSLFKSIIQVNKNTEQKSYED